MRETIITNVIGIVAGVGVGAPLGYVILKSMEQLDMRYIRTFSPLAWIIAVGLTLAASVLINAVAFRKVKKLSLIDTK